MVIDCTAYLQVSCVNIAIGVYSDVEGIVF